MGKRSNFERVERDYYKTPIEAVAPLLPHLPNGATFFEPCAGDGTLVRHLEAAGHFCEYASDIVPDAPSVYKRNAMDITYVMSDYIITNPPWDRKILHPMIEKFSSLRPTWLLFDADWMHTKQSAPYMKRCNTVVSVGRVKWFPETKMTGKENVCWYLFDRSETSTQFFGRP